MYEDDGKTLDYDRLTQLYPPVSPSAMTKQPENLNSSKRKSLRPNNQKETRKISKSSTMKDLTSKTPIKNRTRPAKREEQHELFPSVEKENELDQSRKKDGDILELKSTRRGGKNSLVIRKKVKQDVKDAKPQQSGELEMEVDSNKETAAYSVNSDIINENSNILNENEVNYTGQIMIAESAKVLKKRGRKRKNLEPTQVKKSIELLEVDKTPCYLLNPIPDFLDKFKTENIHSINKLFYFDPIHLSL